MVASGRASRVTEGREQQALKALELRAGGRSTKSIARELELPRSTVRGWFGAGRRAGVAQSAEAIPLKGTKWGFESLHQHQRQAYAYLLGIYLGDGYICASPRSYKLRIYLNRKQLDVIARVKAAISTVLPEHHVEEMQQRVAQVTEVISHSRLWPKIFPQHGPGRKHTRRITLTPCQEGIVREHPAEFLRGCLESDGCRHRRIVNGKDYPAYSFSNRSEDILGLVMWACGLLRVGCRRHSRWGLSIARRRDVVKLDRLFGWKPQLAFAFMAPIAFRPR